jgi:hypothetical protein
MPRATMPRATMPRATMPRVTLLILLALAMSMLATQPLLAQIQPADPTDPVYRYLDRWEALGLLPAGYVLRPYSPEVLVVLLQRVAYHDAAGAADRARARSMLAELSRPLFSPEIVHRSTHVTSTDYTLSADSIAGTVISDGSADLYRGENGAGLRIVSRLLDTIWLSGSVDLLYADRLQADPPSASPSSTSLHAAGQPVSERYQYDYLNAGFDGQATTFYYGLNSLMTMGLPQFWGSLAYGRASAGPFYDNGVVIGPQARAAPYWSLHGQFGPWRFSASLHQLVARGPRTPTSSSYITYKFNKYLAFHSYSVALGSRLDLGLYEATVWAGDFKPLYIVPFSFLYYLQSSNGFSDNSQAGLYAKWRPLDGLLLKVSAFFDDVHAAELLKLHFDTKIIGAAQAGLAWAPRSGPLTLLELDYTGVFPYMYAHWEDQYTPVWNNSAKTFDPVWLQNNYTHFGDSFGAALLPNSDRWELKARLDPLPDISLDFVARLIRHGDASEGIAGGKGGGLFDDGVADGQWTHQPPFVPVTDPMYFRFLTQEVIDTTAQAGLSVACRLPLDLLLPPWLTPAGTGLSDTQTSAKLQPSAPSAGRLSLIITLRYLFEYRWNPDLVPGTRRLNHYVGLDGTLSL